jgi:hypothetical protein
MHKVIGKAANEKPDQLETVASDNGELLDAAFDRTQRQRGDTKAGYGRSAEQEQVAHHGLGGRSGNDDLQAAAKRPERTGRGSGIAGERLHACNNRALVRRK